MKGKKRATTLADIAKKAGLSTSAVSLALRNDRSIPEVTCQRVQKIAKKLGYQRNPYLGSFMKHVRTRSDKYHGTIIFLDLLRAPDLWKEHHVHRLFLKGAEAKAKVLGFRVERYWAREHQDSWSKLVDIFRSRGVVGVIFGLRIHPLYENEELDFAKAFAEFPCAVVGTRYRDTAFDFSMNDQFLTAKTAFFKLIEYGYRRIGYVADNHVEKEHDFRFWGGVSAASQAADVKHRLYAHVHRGVKWDDDCIRWFKRNKPDVILSSRPIERIFVDRLKLRIPEDIGYAILDCDADYKGYAGMRQHSDRVGEAAVEQIFQQISSGRGGLREWPRGTMVESEWQDDASVVRQGG